MKSFSFVVAAIVSATCALGQTNVQSKEAENYRKQSEDIRKQVWSWDMPQFKIRDVPAQYANSSKVVLASHTEITAASKSKLKFYGLALGSKREENLTEIVRELIKLNDKNAVTDYSELSFTQFA